MNFVKAAKEDSVRMSGERKLNLARYEYHICAQQTLTASNDETKVTLTDAVAIIPGILTSGLSIR